MSIKSIFQEMRLSSSRSRRVVQDGSVSGGVERDGLKGSSWANMPSELLRDVLVRIEESENSWPLRKSVVACAGVCKTWRDIIKDLVKVPELSGKLTFPISLKQVRVIPEFGLGYRKEHTFLKTVFFSRIMPGPRDSLIRCFIKRNRSNQTYSLYLNLTSALTDDGKFLFAARRCRRTTCTDYVISLHTSDMSKGSSSYIGKLRSNFLGTKFTIFDGLPPHAGAKLSRCRSARLINLSQVSPRVPVGNYPVAHVTYDLNVLGSRGPRRMSCVMDAIPASAIKPGGAAPTQREFSFSNFDSVPSRSFFRSASKHMDTPASGPIANRNDDALVLRNKNPRWHEQLQCWCLNFHGRVTFASVKNFQLVAGSPAENVPEGPRREKIILQFGKVEKDIFTMDYRYPISAFQAFAISLSSFDTRIGCE